MKTHYFTGKSKDDDDNEVSVAYEVANCKTAKSALAAIKKFHPTHTDHQEVKAAETRKIEDNSPPVLVEKGE